MRTITISLLSKRENEVLKVFMKGKTTKEVAFDMGLSGKTVDHHMGNIKRKLEIDDIVTLTKYCIRIGFTSV